MTRPATELAREGGPPLRREGLPRHVHRRPRRGDRRAEGVALRAHRLEAGPPLRGDAGGRARRSTPRSTRSPRTCRRPRRIRLALRAHLRVVAEQLDVATVFVREWRYLEGERREQFLAERRRYEERVRALFREGRELGRAALRPRRPGLAALLFLSAANWAYTWLRAGADTDALADRFFAPAGRRDARLLDALVGRLGRAPGFA